VDEHCRITVVGERRQVDLAVPAGAPIATYVNTLARLCEQDQTDIMPSAWSLAAGTGATFAPEWSLAELGVADGEVLYLRDIVADEYAEQIVHDVAERVAEEAESPLARRWDDKARTVTITACALGWLVAAMVVIAVRHQLAETELAALSLPFGLLLPVVAWVAMERGWSIPVPLRTGLALCSVPLLALAAWALVIGPTGGGMAGPGGPLTTAGATGAALAVGALAGAILAFLAVPAVTTSAVMFTALVAAVPGLGLAVLRADGTQAAAAFAVVAFALLTAVPATVSGIVVFTHRRLGMRVVGGPEEGDELAGAVREATVLLVAWSGGLCLVLALTLVLMAASTSPYANAAAVLLGGALLLRAGATRLIAEVVPMALAGLTALLTVALVGPAHLGWGSWVGPTYACLLGGAFLAYGFRRLMRRPGLPYMERPRWLTDLSSVLAGASVALVVAAFGAFGRLVGLGHHL
jgi:hypothetical protein